MDASTLKTNMKRRGETDEGQQSKCQRIESSDEQVDETTKITDLIDDCLEKIFDYLDLQSLFSVADASKWLRPAANEIYKRKYGDHSIDILGCDDYRPMTRAYIRCQQAADAHRVLKTMMFCREEKRFFPTLRIRGLETSLKFLRCFGSSIKDVRITYKLANTKRYEYVHRYINEYCAESLVGLWFIQMPNTTAVDQFQKNFVNVKRIVVWECNMTEQWSNFFKLFPNLLQLTILDICLAPRVTENVRFMVTRYTDQKESKTNQSQNRLSMNKLMDAIKDNQSITKLALKTDLMPMVVANDSAMVKRFVSEHPALVDLHLFRYYLTANDAVALIRQLHSMKIFQFFMGNAEYLKLQTQLKDDAEWMIQVSDLNVDRITFVGLSRREQK